MLVKQFLVLLVGLFCVLSPAYGQKLSSAQKEILVLQDQRSLTDGKLISYLQNRDKDLRSRAAIALANIQDTSTITPLIPLLQDEDPQVRAAAAFALGQIGSPTAEMSLMSTLTPDQDLAVVSRVFEALGKCGDEQALNSMISYVPPARNIAVKRDLALSVGRFAIRRIKSERAVWLCYDLLSDNHSDTRSAALYALWRSAPTGVVDLEISKRPDVLVKLMNDRNEEVRVNLAVLLGRTKSNETPGMIKVFYDIEAKDPDWRVQVAIARSAAALSGTNPELLEILRDYLGSLNDHVRIATLMALGGLSMEVVEKAHGRENLIPVLRHLAVTPSKNAELVQGESIVALNKLFPDDFSRIRTEIEKGLKTDLLWAKYVEALSLHPTQDNLNFVIAHLSGDSVRIQMAAWDFIRRMIQPSVLTANKIDTSFGSTIPRRMVQHMLPSLGQRDLAVTTLVANAFADSAIVSMCKRAGFGAEMVNSFVESYQRLSARTDAEAMQAIQATFLRLADTAAVPALEKSLAEADRTVAFGTAQTLRQLTGREYTSVNTNSSMSTKTEPDWKVLEAIPVGQRVTFKTTKGTFTIRLRKDEAPLTVLAIYGLVKKKFFDGLSFHRVVPGFVIQGGDPRGDGWGGPGFAIRSEWSLINFLRGSVGLASSGKDTEGSQFFITHIPTPHLDGRYTVFATVSSGMDVVDRIQVGDRIISAELR